VRPELDKFQVPVTMKVASNNKYIHVNSFNLIRIVYQYQL
jgi:hypothetical protein